jgi:hypothetical protein
MQRHTRRRTMRRVCESVQRSATEAASPKHRRIERMQVPYPVIAGEEIPLRSWHLSH